LKYTVAQTHPPLNSAHVTESVRLSYMLLGYGHKVDYVLVDDGVYLLLEWCGSSFGKESLKRLTAESGFKLFACTQSAESRALAIPEQCTPLTPAQIGEKLLASKVVVF
jgi:sulfur relay (sulfurtransferase) complex TusBCD TusD component (DsrE family)